MLSWLYKRKQQKNCSHDYVSIISFHNHTYLCKHCLKRKKFSCSWDAEEFEIKQMIQGHSVQSEFEYKRNYNKEIKELEVKRFG